MALHRHRWLQLLTGLALGLQMLVASGLAMSAPSPHCGAAHAQTMPADRCQACATHEHERGTPSNGMCKLACAAVSTAAPLPPRAVTTLAPRDAAPTGVVTLHDQGSFDDLLRPPAHAARIAA